MALHWAPADPVLCNPIGYAVGNAQSGPNSRGHCQRWAKPEWLEPLQRSGGRLGLQLVRFHASKLHMRKPVGGVALHAANVDPLPVLQELFVGQEVRLL